MIAVYSPPIRAPVEAKTHVASRFRRRRSRGSRRRMKRERDGTELPAPIRSASQPKPSAPITAPAGWRYWRSRDSKLEKCDTGLAWRARQRTRARLVSSSSRIQVKSRAPSSAGEAAANEDLETRRDGGFDDAVIAWPRGGRDRGAAIPCLTVLQLHGSGNPRHPGRCAPRGC